jgi:hypothetical protein
MRYVLGQDGVWKGPNWLHISKKKTQIKSKCGTTTGIIFTLSRLTERPDLPWKAVPLCLFQPQIGLLPTKECGYLIKVCVT